MRAIGRRAKSVTLGTTLLVSLLLVTPTRVCPERLPIKVYTASDGLASSYVLRIVQDSRGFLWFCTRDGLSRFDGYSFVNYTMADGLPSTTINHLLETRSGAYWVATNGGGVCRLNLEQRAVTSGSSAAVRERSLFTVYPVGHGFANRVNVLFEDREGSVWAGTDDGLFRFEETGGKRRFVRVGLREPERLGVCCLAEDREGSLWIGTSRGLLRRLSDGRFIRYSAQPSKDALTAVTVDHHGRLWLGYPSGLAVFVPEPASQLRASRFESRRLPLQRGSQVPNLKSVRLPALPGEARWYTTAEGLADESVFAICAHHDGSMWISTEGGLTEFNGERFRNHALDQGLSHKWGNDLREDRDGNLWIAAYAEGAIKLTLNGFTTYTEADGIGRNQIHSIYEDLHGNLYAVSGRWFVSRFDGKRFISVRPVMPAGASYSSGSPVAFLDRQGEWWMLTSTVAYRFGRVRRIEQLAHARPIFDTEGRGGLTSDHIAGLFEDSRGDIWMSAGRVLETVLTKWERATDTIRRYPGPQGLPTDSAPYVFCEDRSGNLWIGFYGGGLARYAAGRYTVFKEVDGLPAGGITALHLDQAGRLWIGSSAGGLCRIDEPAADRPRLRTYSTEQGLSSNNVRCITEDQWGNVYAGTARGVERINPESGTVKCYTTDEGLANGFVTAAFRDRRNNLWFATWNGLSRLIPEPDHPHSPTPILIGGLRIAGNSQPISELGETAITGLVLGPDQNHIQIDFLTLSFAAGERPDFQYRLEGASQGWSAPLEQRTVHLVGLAPGKYLFMVRAIGVDGLTSATPATVAFTILQPVWQRWWFVSLAAMLTALLVYTVHRYRTAQLVELERVRTRIATDLHDDIGSSLSQISVLSEVIGRDLGSDARAAALRTIAGLSRDMLDGMNDIVWAINPHRDRLSDLTQRMRRFSSDIFTARHIEFQFHASGPQPAMRIGTDVRREVFLIFKESINNIVRHSACTQAEIDFLVKDHRLELSLKDNGKGFDPAQALDGNGLGSMRQRAMRIGGTLELVSTRGQGTTVTLRAPLGRR
jgi:ligand-binding sensor domain-containing protein/signal transduction histidine kinase